MPSRRSFAHPFCHGISRFTCDRRPLICHWQRASSNGRAAQCVANAGVWNSYGRGSEPPNHKKFDPNIYNYNGDQVIGVTTKDAWNNYPSVTTTTDDDDGVIFINDDGVVVINDDGVVVPQYSSNNGLVVVPQYSSNNGGVVISSVDRDKIKQEAMSCGRYLGKDECVAAQNCEWNDDNICRLKHDGQLYNSRYTVGLYNGLEEGIRRRENACFGLKDQPSCGTMNDCEWDDHLNSCYLKGNMYR